MLKNSWWIFVLIALGGVVLLLSMHPKVQNDQGVVLSDIFHQQAVPIREQGTPPAEPKKADPVPPMAIVMNPVNNQEVDFTIQVYSFQDHNRAETALEALKNSGYKAFIIVSDLGEKGTWYRVRIGGIGDELAAHQMLEEIRKNYNSGFIIKPHA